MPRAASGGRRCWYRGRVRLVIARCQVDYGGKLTAHLPMATRLIMIKADGAVSVHADDRAYKPLNWMTPPCTLTVRDAPADLAATTAELDERIDQVWTVRGGEDTLQIAIAEIIDDSEYDLGVEPGLRKDGVEAHLQALLAENPGTFGEGFTLVRREYPTPIGPVDIMLHDARGAYVAVEVKRRGEARVLAADRGITCLTVDYDALRGIDNAAERLF